MISSKIFAMKILLINPVTRESDIPKYFPLGLGLIGSLLEKNGHDVQALDLNVLRWGSGEVESFLAKADADVFALTGLVTDYDQVSGLAQTLKQYHPQSKVILGGGLASSFWRYILDSTQIDYVLPGEGEIALPSLLTALAKGESPAGLRGVAYKVDGRAQLLAAPGIMENLDVSPRTNYDLFSWEQYAENMKKAWMFSQPTRALSVCTSRGCPYHCIYCDKAIFGNRFRQRSVAGVIDEIEDIVDRYELEGVLFADDTFTLKRAWILDFCREFQKRLPNIRWAGNGRVGLLDEQVVSAMAAAGCDTIGFGIESGSQIILDELRKGVTVKQAKETISLVESCGIRPLGYITLGSFSETKETAKETIAFLKETGLKAGVNFLTPFPGTPLFAEAVARGKITKNPEQLLGQWTAWQDRLMVNLSELDDENLIDLKSQVQLHAGGRGKSFSSLAYTLSAEQQEQLWDEALGRIAGDGHKDFIVFGAGSHTVRLLKWLRGKPGLIVRAVFDEDPQKVRLGAIEDVTLIGELPDSKECPAILLSSDAYEDQMHKKAVELFFSPRDVYRIYGNLND